MKYEQYKFKFYLNANHAIQINGRIGQIHPHTWEISIVALKLSDKFISFNDVETIVDKMFDQYQDKFINEIEPFNMMNPTLENICEVFKEKISEILKNADWELLKIEVSETPARSYVISLSDDDNFKSQISNAAEMDYSSREKMITDIINECHRRSTIDPH
ncbi:MAG TPA: 6-carboxytetrahydropterin synthase [Oscillospiraceae bacterium]|nr:6-carboxytetrahydropterin synthase [Oscillospiraceae bacterium]